MPVWLRGVLVAIAAVVPGPAGAEGRSRVAVVTPAGGDDDAALCLRHRLADLLAEGLAKGARDRLLVLNRSQILRVEPTIAGQGPAGASRMAARTRADLVVFGEVLGSTIQMALWNGRELKEVRLDPVVLDQANPQKALLSVFRGVLARLEPLGAPPAGLPALTAYPEQKACAAYARARVVLDPTRPADVQRAHALLLPFAGTGARIDALLGEIAARLAGTAGGAERDLGPALVGASRAVEAAPDLAEAHHGLGIARDFAGQRVSAMAAYRRAIELDPGFAGPQVNLARLLHQEGRTREALEILEEAVALDPEWASVRHTRAVIRLEAGDGQGALDDLERLDEALQAIPQTRLLRAKALCLSGRTSEALGILGGLTERPEVAWVATLEKGLALLLAGREAAALEALQQLVAGTPKLADHKEELRAPLVRAVVARSRALMANHLRAEAMGLLEELIKEDAAYSHPSLREALALLLVAQEGAPRDRGRGLLVELSELTRWPLVDEAWYDLGVLKHRQGDLSGAAVAYDRALELNPRAAWAAYNRGLCALEQGEPAVAVGLFERVLALDPRAGDAATALGVALHRLGRAAEAVAAWRGWLEKARAFDPQPPMPPALLHNLTVLGELPRTGEADP
jgi:tetratricopeptide (TPR) repeat protein